MIKTIKKFALIFPILMMISCTLNSALVMPFEATFHKYVDTLTDGLERIEYNSETSYIICENENYSVAICNDTIAFIDKNTGMFYDTFGNMTAEMPQTGLNIIITKGEDFELKYKNGKYYNSETDEYIDSLTAYKLNENSVRILIVTGIDEFKPIGKTPLVLTAEYIKSNPKIEQYYSNDANARDAILESYPLLEERLDIHDGLYYLTENIPENEFTELGFTKNTAREVALKLNYKYSDVKMILTTVDITLNEYNITFDISKNRQFRSELIRDKSFTHKIFDFDINFIEKTASESKKITDAQSKY